METPKPEAAAPLPEPLEDIRVLHDLGRLLMELANQVGIFSAVEQSNYRAALRYVLDGRLVYPMELASPCAAQPFESALTPIFCDQCRQDLRALVQQIDKEQQDDDFPDAVMRVGYQAQADALAPKHQPEACIACGERNDGGYMVEDGPGPFCSQCWQLLERNFFA